MPDEVLRFGAFELDLSRRVLSMRGRRVNLQRRPFELLAYLVRNRPRVVPREELAREVWAGTVVGPEAIRFAVHSVRQALGGGGVGRRIVETVPRVGLRFSANVEVVNTLGSRQEGVRNRYVPELLGRESLLKSFTASLDALDSDMGGTLLVYGEPGIGKSTCLTQLQYMAEMAGFHVLGGAWCRDDSRGSVAEWIPIRSTISGSPAAPLDPFADSAADKWSWSRVQSRGEFSASGAVARATLDQKRFFGQVVARLRSLTRELPVVAVFDDIHAADVASASLVQHAVLELNGERILFAITYRDGPISLRSSLRSIVSRIAIEDGCRTCRLEGLDKSEILRFVESLYRIRPHEDQLLALRDRTRGNPLFLRLVLQALQAEGRIEDLRGSDVSSVELPRYLQSPVLDRIALLPETSKEVLRAASVGGVSIRASEVSLAIGKPFSFVVDRLSDLASEGILDHGDSPGGYRFSHLVVREAVYDSLAESARSALHSAFAASIQESASSTMGARAGEVASHIWSSGDPGLSASGAQFATKAAEWEGGRGAFESAAAHLERASVLYSATRTADPRTVCDLWIRTGDARLCAGQRELARNAFLTAVSTARSLGQPEEFARAVLRVSPDFLAIETGVFDPGLVALLGEALERLPRESSIARAQVSARLAVALHWSDESTERRRSLISEAVRQAEQSRIPELSSYIAIADALAFFSIDDPARFGSCPKSANPIAEPQLDLVNRLMRITSCWLRGELGQVHREVQAFADSAAVVGAPQAKWYVSMLRASLCLFEGRYMEAEAFREVFGREGRSAADRNSDHSILLQAFMASIDLGTVEKFEGGLREIVNSFPRVLGWRSGLLLFLIEVGRFDEATRLLDEIIEGGALEKPKRNEWYALIGALAIAASRLNNRVIAEQLYAMLLPHKGQLAVVGYGSYCWGATDQLLGICAATCGEWRDGLQHLENAIGLNERIGALPAVVRSQYDSYVVCERAGERALAKGYQEACRVGAERLGMSRLVQRVDGEIAWRP